MHPEALQKVEQLLPFQPVVHTACAESLTEAVPKSPVPMKIAALVENISDIVKLKLKAYSSMTGSEKGGNKTGALVFSMYEIRI